MYGTQLVITLTTKEDYMSRRPAVWMAAAKARAAGGGSQYDHGQEYDLEGRAVDHNGSQRRSQ